MKLAGVLMGLGACGAWTNAAADRDPLWDYVQLDYVSARLQSDETGDGGAVQLSTSLTDQVFVVGSGITLDARYDDASIPDEELQAGSIGLGFHSRDRRQPAFAQLSYVTSRMRGDGFDVRGNGWQLLVGEHFRASRNFALEPAAGVSWDENSNYDTFLRLNLAVGIVGPLWVVAGYTTSTVLGDSRTWSGGLRYTFGEVPRRTAGVRAGTSATGEPGSGLQIGQAVVVQRPLVLQQYALFGAKEVATVAAGQSLVLEKTEVNTFGPWWYVTAGEQQGWIREGHLK